MPPRKTPIAPPAYRPQPTPKVLQTKLVPGRAQKSFTTPATPVKTCPAPLAPPVYNPQSTPKVLQRKQVIPALRTVPPTRPRPATPPARPTAIQPKAAMPNLVRMGVGLKSSNSHIGNAGAPRGSAPLRPALARTNLASTIQRAAAAYSAWMRNKKAFIEELEDDHYLLQGLTANVVGTVTNAHHTVRNVKALDMTDASVVHSELKDRLTELISSVHIRPATPTHDNLERNLPTGSTYYELGMEGGGGARIIYDTSNSDIYFSYHYGGRQNGLHTDSPFIKLSNLTGGQRAVTKYKILFFQLEANAYKKALKMKGNDWAIEAKLAGLENTLDGHANTASNYFKNIQVPAEPAIDAVVAEMWRIYNRAKAQPKAGFTYLNSCIGVMKNINATHTL